ncbi:MAG: exocyst complex component exo84, partial [Chaenotheca gracillima]
KAKEEGMNGPELDEVVRPPKKKQLTESAYNQLKTLAQSKPSNDDTKIESLPTRSRGDPATRSTMSHFWGPAFGSSLWDEAKAPTRVEDEIRLAIPLPQLTAEIFEDTDQAQADRPESIAVEPGSRAEHQYVKSRPGKENGGQDDVFVVKELGG